MTIQTLGEYPNNAPLPTGGGYGMYAPDGGQEYGYNNTVAAVGLVGWQVGIGITPSRVCRWRVHGQTIWRSPDDIWSTAGWGLRLSQADLDGYQDLEAQNWTHANTVDWQNGRVCGTYRLAAGVYYTCYLYWFWSSGYTQYAFSAEHSSIHGHILDEGAV